MATKLEKFLTPKGGSRLNHRHLYETTSLKLFAASCALGLSLWAGTPFKAQAANECTGGVAPAVGSTVTCATGSYATGITYSVANLTVNLNAGVLLTGTTGVVLGTTGAAATLGTQTINAVNSPTVNEPGVGLAAFGVAATVNVTGGTITTASPNGHGVQAFGSGGNVAVTVSGTTISTSGTTAHAINATTSGTGTITVSNSGNLTVSGSGANTINATQTLNGTGTVSVTQSGGIVKLTNAGAGAGILATSNGNVDVTMSGGSITNNGTAVTSRGIDARALGTGSATVTMTAGSISTNAGIALAAWNAGVGTSTGAISVTTSTGTSITSASQNGIHAVGGSAAAGTAVLVDSHSTINAGNNGIFAQGTNGANVTVTQTGASITSVAPGINATTAGTISVSNSGTIQTSGASGHGIQAQSAGSTGQTVTVANSNTIQTGGTNASGIFAQATAAGGGLVKVTNSGAIITTGNGSNGIVAQQTLAASTADVTVDNTAAITVNGTGNPATGPGPKGIFATTLGSGNVTVTGSGNITMSNAGDISGYGIIAQTVTGTAKVDYSGTVITQGNDASGLRAFSSTTGAAIVNYTGPRVEVFNDAADAIYAFSQSGSVTVTAQGELITHGLNNSAGGDYGIFAGSTSSDALHAVSVTFTGSKIEVDGTGSDAIFASSAYNGGNGQSPVTVTNSGTLISHGSGGAGIRASTLPGALTVINSGAISTLGAGTSPGIVLSTSTGALKLTNSGAITTQGAGASTGINASTTTGALTINNGGAIMTSGTGARGINTSTSSGVVNIGNTATIQTAGPQARGINAFASGGSVTIVSSGAITTAGSDSDGIATNTGAIPVKITNTAAIQTAGSQARGINAFASGGSVDVVSSGPITTTGASLAGGVLINSANAITTANVSNDITTSGSFSPAIEVITNTTGGNLLYYHDGTAKVQGFTNAISLWEGGDSAIGTGTIHIGANTTVDASAALTGVQGLMLGSNHIQIDARAVVTGGSGSGVAVSGQTSRLDNAGVIGAMSDFAVNNFSFGTTNQSFDITNAASGVITGYMTLGPGTNTLNNRGLWSLRNFSDSNGDGNRDRLAVAISDFGTSGANTINNNGTIALLGHGSVPVTTLDTTGMYLPFGFSFNTMAATSPTQGQILGVTTFNNAGVIDLRANTENGLPPDDPSSLQIAGDVLVISGGHTAGADGGGVFVANGGTLKLNTVLNEGGANSQSDILVVDSTRLGAGATAIAITPVGTPSVALTVGNGIALVEVLNKSASPDGVFTLGNRLAAGPYEYLLFHGGSGADSTDGNWYLRNVYNPPPSPPSPPLPPEPQPIIRPEVPVDMVIPPLALEYGYALLDTLHERVGETYLAASRPVTEERVVWCKDPTANFTCRVRVPVATANGAAGDEARWARSGWARLIGDRGFHEPDNFMRRGPNYNYAFGAIQAGLDIFAREQADGTLDKIGIYAGYGQIRSSVKGQPGAFYGGKAGSVNMDAYTLGGYWTHFSPNGWYVDAVVQGTWYATDARSVLGERIKPDGFGILGSLEGGYTFKFGSGWTLEPQAQIVYQNVSFDHARDALGFVAFDDGDSLRGRLGIRLTKSWNMADQGRETRLVTAWLRANVWHEFLGRTKTSFGTLDGSNLIPFHSYLGGTWGEIGVGVTAKMTSKINIFATGAYNRSLDNKGREGWDGRLGMTMKW